MKIKVGTMLHADIKLPDYGSTFYEVCNNNDICRCGENDLHTLVVLFNWDVGLNKETNEYTMPYNRRGTVIKVCGKDIEKELKSNKIKIVNKKESEYRKKLYNNGGGNPIGGFA